MAWSFFFGFGLLLYTHLYTHLPALRTGIDTITDGANTHPPTSIAITINHTTPQPPPVSLLPNNQQPSSVHPNLSFSLLLFYISTGIALAAATPTRDLVENLVYFLSLVFRLVS